MKTRNATQEDRVNLRILECLAKHGRMPYAQIAETLKLSANAVRDRILSMERRGVIRSYHAVLDDRSLGTSMHALAFTEPAPRQPEALKALGEHPDVISVAESSGRYGLVIEIRAASMEAIHDVLAKTALSFGYKLADVLPLGDSLQTATAARVQVAN